MVAGSEDWRTTVREELKTHFSPQVGKDHHCSDSSPRTWQSGPGAPGSFPASWEVLLRPRPWLISGPGVSVRLCSRRTSGLGFPLLCSFQSSDRWNTAAPSQPGSWGCFPENCKALAWARGKHSGTWCLKGPLSSIHTTWNDAWTISPIPKGLEGTHAT